MTREQDMNVCEYCGRVPEKPCGICRSCYFGGDWNDKTFPGLRARISDAVPGLSRADWDGATVKVQFSYSGGGGFALEVIYADGRMGYATQAFQDVYGEWEVESGLPDPTKGECWALGFYASEEAFVDGADPLEDLRYPLTDDELVIELASFATEEN